MIRAYQRYVVLPGPLLALIVLAGLTGIALTWRSLGGPALPPWLVGTVLIATPAATAGYGARYLVASIPSFCIAAAIGVREISGWLAEPVGAMTSSITHSRKYCPFPAQLTCVPAVRRDEVVERGLRTP